MSKITRKRNVMHLVLSLEIGGLERLVTDLAIGIDKEKYNVEVCCFNNLSGYCEALVSKGIKVTLMPRNQKHHDYLYALKLQKMIVDKNIDILHMHNGTFFHGIQAGLLARIPAMVYTDHGRQLVESKIDVILDRLSGCIADKIVAVSSQLEDYLINKIKLPKDKTITIINGINTDMFGNRIKSKKLMQELGILENHMVIGTVGRLAEVKDQSTLIDAFNLVRKIVPDSVLLIVGDGVMRHDLEAKIARLGLAEVVKITGNRGDINDILNLLDVFVLSSLSEGTSIALLEAMASGVPPVVTNVGGNLSIVDNNINGLVVKPKQVNQLAEQLILLLMDMDKRDAFGRAAAAKVITKYSISNTINQYCKLYDNILASKGIFIN